MAQLLGKMARLAYLERITRDLPEQAPGVVTSDASAWPYIRRILNVEHDELLSPSQFAHLAPRKPEGVLAWSSPSADDTTPESIAAESAELMRRLRAKESQQTVLEWLGTTRAATTAPADDRTSGGALATLIVHSLLDAGAKSAPS